MSLSRNVLGMTIFFAALTALPTPAAAGDPPDVTQMIESAATRADHAALTAYFEKEAADARAKAERHSRMEASYKKLSGAQVEKSHLDRHCRSLVKAAMQMAEDNEALAKAHRTIAENMK